MRLFDTEFEPMLLSEENHIFDSKEFLYEMKFDGMRALVFVSSKKFRILNRHKRDITYLFPELKEIQKIASKPTIFDGEIISFSEGVPNFSKLQKRIHLKKERDIKNASLDNPVLFLCFDILYDGSDLTSKPLIERKKILKKFSDNDAFVKVSYILEKGSKFFSKIQKLNLEGVVAKCIHSKYEINARSNDWIKIKNLKIDSFFIGGYMEKKSTSMFSICLGTHVDNCYVFVGKVSVPRKSGLLDLLKKEKILKKSSFSNFEDNHVNFIKPKYICYVKYLEKSKDGILRHPVFIGFDE